MSSFFDISSPSKNITSIKEYPSIINESPPMHDYENIWQSIIDYIDHNIKIEKFEMNVSRSDDPDKIHGSGISHSQNYLIFKKCTQNLKVGMSRKNMNTQYDHVICFGHFFNLRLIAINKDVIIETLYHNMEMIVDIWVNKLGIDIEQFVKLVIELYKSICLMVLIHPVGEYICPLEGDFFNRDLYEWNNRDEGYEEYEDKELVVKRVIYPGYKSKNKIFSKSTVLVELVKTKKVSTKKIFIKEPEPEQKLYLGVSTEKLFIKEPEQKSDIEAGKSVVTTKKTLTEVPIQQNVGAGIKLKYKIIGIVVVSVAVAIALVIIIVLLTRK